MLFSSGTSMEQQDPSLAHGIWSGLMQESANLRRLWKSNLEERSDGMWSPREEMCVATYRDANTLPPVLLRGKILSRRNQWQMQAAKPELCSISREGTQEGGTKDVWCVNGMWWTIADYTLQNEQMLFFSVCYTLTFNKNVPTFVKRV